MSCSICCEDYTKSLRKEIKCKNCENTVCLVCFKRHLLDNRNLECMFPNCKKAFSFTEISSMTSSVKFSNEIMDKIAEIALEEEKNFLPQRQNLAKRRLEEQKFSLREFARIKERTQIYKDKNSLQSEIMIETKNNPELLDIEEQIKNLKQRKYNLLDKLNNDMREKLKPYEEKIRKINEENEKDRRHLGIVIQDKKDHYKFVKQCSFENCKGFLEDNPEDKGWKCRLCDKFTCRKCHEPLVSTICPETNKKLKHRCNEDVIANLKEMKKDTKPCPKCGTAIFKIDGCFDYETKIPIYGEGYKLAKDILIGDEVIGLDLKPRKVLKVCNGRDKMFLVKQKGSLDYKVNSLHTLIVKNTNCYLEKWQKGFRVYYNFGKYIFFEKLDQAYLFLEAKKDELLEITIKDYINLDPHVKIFLKGVKVDKDLQHHLIDIEVKEVDEDNYVGFMVNQDNKFILTDYTIVKNCNMMFCISCQTYFDWASGKIYKRAVHNPDAIRWMRENGRAIARENGDDGCTDPLVNNQFFYNWMYRNARSLLNDNVIFNTIMDLTNYGTHIVQIVLPRFEDNYANKSQNIAIDYLITESYSDHKWSRDIRKFKKQQMFYTEIRNIINLLVEVLRSVLGNIREMIERRTSKEEIVSQLELIPKVAEECNSNFEDIKACFNSKRKDKFYIKRDKPKVLFSLSFN